MGKKRKLAILSAKQGFERDFILWSWDKIPKEINKIELYVDGEKSVSVGIIGVENRHE